MHLSENEYRRRRDNLAGAIEKDSRVADDERDKARSAKDRGDTTAERAFMWRAGRADEAVARWRLLLDQLNDQWRRQGGR